MANRYYNNYRIDGERLSANDLESIEAGFAFLDNDSLLIANNLGDLPNAALARESLGLGTAAAALVGTATGTVAAGDHDHNITGDIYLYGSNNLTDVPDPNKALSNLGMGSAAGYEMVACLAGPTTLDPLFVAQANHAHDTKDILFDSTITGYSTLYDALAACINLVHLLVPSPSLIVTQGY